MKNVMPEHCSFLYHSLRILQDNVSEKIIIDISSSIIAKEQEKKTRRNTLVKLMMSTNTTNVSKKGGTQAK